MATNQRSPTVPNPDEAKPAVGLNHPTVVPANFDPEETDE